MYTYKQILWQVMNENTGELYTGTYETWMTFTYVVTYNNVTGQPNNAHVILTRADNLQPNVIDNW